MGTPSSRNRDLARELLGDFSMDLSSAQAPQQVGSYRVVSVIGEGGMGQVLEAERLDQAGGPKVAIKLLSEGRYASLDLRARFLREARALATIDHPNVVAVKEVGEHDGAPFLALEYYPGGSLATLLKERGRLEPSEVAEIGARLAAGLAEAHRCGLLHRDLKPENVLLSAGGVPVLCDFGLAKATRPAGQSALTESGVLVGTPGFFAPEQASSEPLGPAVDVYGLGATLYALLTGRPPITGKTLLEVVVATADRAPPPIRSRREGVPAALERVVMRCLAKDPAERWASAEELSRALWEAAKAEPGGGWRTGRAWFAGLLMVTCAVSLLVALNALGLRAHPETGTEGSVEADSPGDGSPPGGVAPQVALETARQHYADSPQRAVELLRPLCAGGDPIAQYELCVLLSKHPELASTPDEGLVWLWKSVNSGCGDALNFMGLLHVRGEWVEADEALATAFYRRAAEAGSLEGMFNYANSLHLGAGVAQDLELAEAWYRRAAEAGQPKAMAYLGYLITTGPDPRLEVGLQWYLAAAEAGDPDGMFFSGIAFLTGRGAPRDPLRGERWIREAAGAGHPGAMSELGVILENAAGRATEEAVGWYRRSAMADDRNGMFNFGLALLAGSGVGQDEVAGAEWVRRSAERGRVDAMRRYGELCLEGRGVPQDEAAANAWFERAEQTGQIQAPR